MPSRLHCTTHPVFEQGVLANLTLSLPPNASVGQGWPTGICHQRLLWLRRPPPPRPPPQFPWRAQVAGTFANCALTRLMGLTLDRNGGIAGEIWVRFWADGWEGAWTQSSWVSNEGYAGLDDSSNWDGVLATYAKPGTWHACVVPAQGGWDCISPTVTAQTVADPCLPDSGGVQIVRIAFQQH